LPTVHSAPLRHRTRTTEATTIRTELRRELPWSTTTELARAHSGHSATLTTRPAQVLRITPFSGQLFPALKSLARAAAANFRNIRLLRRQIAIIGTR
jgi:hypothetical protein